MKKITLLFVLFFSAISFSQEKVEWKIKFNGVTSNIEITADIAEGWHLYSQHINPEVGPIPTQFKFTQNKSIELIEEIVEGIPIEKFDENFEAKLSFFEGKSIFKQKIRLNAPTVLELHVTFMVCNDVMCLPPVEKQLSIEIK